MNEKKPFWRTKIFYSLLLAVLTCLYLGMLLAFHVRRDEKTPPSEAISQFQSAEKNWQQRMGNEKAMEAYMTEHPVEGAIFNLFALLFIGAFILGIVFDFMLILKRDLRQRLIRDGPADPVEWGMGMLCRVVILWIILSLGLSFLFAFLKDSYFMASMNTFVILHTTIMDLVGAALIVWTVRRAKGHWRDLGFHLKFKEIFKEIGVGLFGYLCVLPIFFLILIGLVLLARLMAYEPPPHPLVEIFLEEEKRAPALIGYSIFLGSIAGPILEELFFRGFCYPILRRNWGTKLALVLTALFFAFIHQNEFAFIPIFILGIGLGLLYETRKNLIAPITMHIVHNCFFMAYFFAAKHMILSANAG